ncbi:MAG: polysaccharide biosynthesis protein [Planctomycetes bacterium]|nr:polysaccharide biosynthesis protein [Planctomycetota bacterium]
MNIINNQLIEAFKDFFIKNRRVVVTTIHILQVVLANYLAFLLRFEIALSSSYVNQLVHSLPILLVIRFVLYLQAGMYKDLWRYSSISDMISIIRTVSIGSVVFFIINRYFVGNVLYPPSVYVLEWILLLFISCGTRLFIRVCFKKYRNFRSSTKKILIIGTIAGEAIVREMKNNPKSSYIPIGFMDEDPYKKGLEIHGVPIFGQIDTLESVIKKQKPDEILISMVSTDSKTIKSIYDQCKPFNIPIKKLPGINDILVGNISVEARLGQRLIDANLVSQTQIQEALALQKKEGGMLGSILVKSGYIKEEELFSYLTEQSGISRMKPISLEDLIQREQVRYDIQSVREFIEGKTVMVTGAGGSIGSELCRQLIKYNPAHLLLYERYENSLFHIDHELTRFAENREKKNFTPVIGDMLDKRNLEYVFSTHRPQIVFHAAAHKHVPLLEQNPLEAVKNNVFGTKNVIEAAVKYNAESFVLISSDKAVNPTSTMGATKRIAEFLTIAMNAFSTTKFSTVRFGNVLGSNGSVIKIFEEQLQRGGPLTVTHPEIKRFFMLIPEAIQLVLMAAALKKGGEILVLDMGEQIKIVELAENLIRLSGFIPHKEIKVEFTGLRPGEKLYEELFDKSEQVISTLHEKFWLTIPDTPSLREFNNHIAELERIVRDNAIDEVVSAIKDIVPSFKCDSDGVNDQSPSQNTR